VSELFEALRASLLAEQPAALATVVERSEDGGIPQDAPDLGAKRLVRADGPPLGTIGPPELDRAVLDDLVGSLESGLTTVRHYGWHGEARGTALSVFIEAFTPPPRLVVFGAVDFTRALAHVGKALGFRVTVCDARPVFATRVRFPQADEVVVDWPDRYLAREGARLGPKDAVCVLTHDAKFDVPALVGALATNVGYIGAMGSRRTKADRERRLREVGVTDDQLARVMAPIGLDIGARTPEETAVAICAEIISVRSGNLPVASLRDGDGPIHRGLVPPAGIRGG
jgi:xanthine dehydrogenase accessory factor